jgi:hypothetical protein
MFREQKMHFRWLGLYKVKEAVSFKGTYILKELNYYYSFFILHTSLIDYGRG